MNLKHAAAALALTSLVAAGAAQAAPKEITVAIASTFTTLDPYDASDTLSQTASKSFYEGLFTFDKDMKVIDALATDYKVSDDGLVYTVTLRKGVKFHDGSEFQADAVKANFDRVTNKANGLKRYMLYQNIEKTEVVDPYTVRFTLKKPFSSFINQLAHPAGVMICPSTLANKTNKQIAFEPCGTGPYTLDKYNPRTQTTGRQGSRNSMPLTGSRSLRTAPALRCFSRAKHSLLSRCPPNKSSRFRGRIRFASTLPPPSFFAMLK